MSRQLSQREEVIQSLRLALDEATQHIADLKRNYAAAQVTHTERMNNHTRECQQEISTLREHLYNMEIAKASGRAFANDTKVSDTAIVDCWKRMAYNVCSLANAFLTRCPKQAELAAGHQQNADTGLQMTADEYALLADMNTRSAVVECFIWRSIVGSVFGGSHLQNQTGAWGGLTGIRFHGLCSSLMSKMSQSTAADFFHWRSQGAVLIETTMGLQDQLLRKHAVREQLRFSVLLPLDKRKDRSASDALHQDLLSVFRDALWLFSTFMKSRALFHVHWASRLESSKERVAYDPAVMEEEVRGIGSDDGRSIVLNVSPGLSKIGTADGTDYDRTMILVKPKVVCN
ncbi:hypothetical protein CcaCcLH18_07895 [Colletotrichum camelliae]|nr:hypothetical protein CcaCcLH18_07895 [Colletotrichum camelliae]